jgi:23S rRNA (guanosine2251-2'-O)-methyltransferase
MPQFLYGKNTVLSALQRRQVNKIFLTKNFNDQLILTTLKQTNITVERLEESKLIALIQVEKGHQGIVALVDDFVYTLLPDFLQQTQTKASPLIVMLDGVEDPQNFGAIIRNCAGLYVDAIIIRKDQQVGITPTVAKIASGALPLINIIQVTNLAQTLEVLKKHRYWIVATALQDAIDYRKFDYRGPICLVLGSEASGIRRLVLERSDARVFIPLNPALESFNVASATAIMLAEVYRQRFPLK